MNILILGSSSRVGIKLINELIKNTNLNIIAHSRSSNNYFNRLNIKKVYFDVMQDNGKLKKYFFSSDIIINCIAEYKDITRMKYLNFFFFNDLLSNNSKNFLEKKIHWIQLSSIGVYNNYNQNSRINELSDINFSNYYEETKFFADNFLQKFSKDNINFSYTIVRPSILFGSLELDKTLNKFQNIINNKFLTIFLDPQSNIPLLHIDDLIKLLVIVIDSRDCTSKNQIFNISNNVNINEFTTYKIRNNYFVNFLRLIFINLTSFCFIFLDKIFKKNLYLKYKIFISRNYFDNSKLKLLLKFQPNISIKNYYANRDK